MVTAEDAARAIVQACRETGENPIRAASGLVKDRHGPTIRARHYAMHALLHCFQGLSRLEAARMVGCPGKASYFYSNSLKMVVNKPAAWWDGAAFERVIAAVEVGIPTSGRQVPQEPPKPEPPPYKHGPLPPGRHSTAVKAKRPSPGAGRLESGGYRPAEGTIEAILEDDADDAASDAVFDRGTISPNMKRARWPDQLKSRREMDEDLRQAVLNTAKMTPPRED